MDIIGLGHSIVCKTVAFSRAGAICIHLPLDCRNFATEGWGSLSKERKVIRTKRLYKKERHTKWIGKALFILFLVLLVGLGYIVSREWSENFHFGETGSLPEVSSAPSLPEVSEPPGESSSPVSSEASSQPEPVSLSYHGVIMPVAEMWRTGDSLAAYFQSLRDAGYDAVCMDLKTEDGRILYNTSVEEARLYRAVAESPVDLDALVKAAKDAGLSPIARISALKDPLAPHVDNENSFGFNNTNEYNWLDDSPANGGKPWLNPYMPKARAYVAAFCAEAAGKGFDAILLSNVNFPTKNTTQQMGTLTASTLSREEILTQLVEECQTAAGTIPVRNAYNAAWAYSWDTCDTPYRYGGGENRRAPLLNLESIEANRGEICARLGFTAENGAVPADLGMDAILSAMLNADDAPIVRQVDLPIVQPVLEAKGITSYLVY